MKRYRAAALCMALALGLTACGKEAGTGSSSTAASPAGQTQMGRWIESQVDLGGREIAGSPTLLEDGSLVLFVYELDQQGDPSGPLTRLTSTDNGETWTEDNPGWSSQVDGFINQVWAAADGTVCLSSVVLDEEQRSGNTTSLYLKTPEGELEPLELQDMDYVSSATFYQEELLLFTQSYSESGMHIGMTAYNLQTGESRTVALSEDVGYSGAIQPVEAGGKLLFVCYNETGMELMELNPQDGSSIQVLSPLSEAVSPMALAGDEDGAIYYPTPKGIYRLAAGGTLPEQLVAGDGMALSVNSNYPFALCRADNGDFLVTFSEDNSSMTIYRYHYDETLPTHADTTLNVWALRDSSTARAAINLYKQQHPEVDVVFTVAIPEEAQDPAAARSDALTQLNTELLAGEGPDLIILDGVEYETYADKGLLADLSDVLPLDSLQSNITDPFVQDGTVYAMPARFSVPVLIGDEGTLDTLTDLSAMQQAVLDAAPRPDFGDQSPDFYEGLPDEEKYALRLTSAEELADFLLPVTAEAILQGDSLNEEALNQVMTFVEEVARYYGIQNYTMENNTSSAQSWSGSDVISIWPTQGEYTDCSHAKYGWFSMDTPYSVMVMARREQPLEFESEKIPCDMILRPGLTTGAYTPQVLVGVNAGSGHLDAAKELAAAFFDTAVQGNYYSDGITVRADCLAEKLDAVLGSEQYPTDSYVGDLRALLDSCTTPVIVPALLRDSFVEHADAIIQGQENAQEAAAGIRDDLSLYLAERQ